MRESTKSVVQEGLLVIAKPGTSFPSRSGNLRNYVLDARGAGTNLVLRSTIVSAFEARLAEIPNVDLIAGIAKSGIVWGAWLAWKQGLPYASILLDGKRSSGLQRETEGEVRNKNVILIDNWVRTGLSLLKAVEVVERNGGNVQDVIVITQYKPLSLPIRVHSCWDLEELFEAAKAEGIVPPDFIFQ